MEKIKPEILIFDFDGTLADTKALYYDEIKKELGNFKFSDKTIGRAIDWGLTLRKTLRRLGFNFLYTYILSKRIHKNVKRKLPFIKKCRKIDTIKSIKTRKIIVTNSVKDSITPIVKHYQLEKQFKEIYTGDDFPDKAEFILNYLKQNNIDVKKAVYIGDRVADIGVAKKVGCVSLIVAGKCAWDSPEDIIKNQPDIVLENLNDLNKILA